MAPIRQRPILQRGGRCEELPWPGEGKLGGTTEFTTHTSWTSHNSLGAGVALPIGQEAGITYVRAPGWAVEELRSECRPVRSQASSFPLSTPPGSHNQELGTPVTPAGSAPNWGRADLYQALHPPKMLMGQKPCLRTAAGLSHPGKSSIKEMQAPGRREK